MSPPFWLPPTLLDADFPDPSGVPSCYLDLGIQQSPSYFFASPLMIRLLHQSASWVVASQRLSKEAMQMHTNSSLAAERAGDRTMLPWLPKSCYVEQTPHLGRVCPQSALLLLRLVSPLSSLPTLTGHHCFQSWRKASLQPRPSSVVLVCLECCLEFWPHHPRGSSMVALFIRRSGFWLFVDMVVVASTWWTGRDAAPRRGPGFPPVTLWTLVSSRTSSATILTSH